MPVVVGIESFCIIEGEGIEIVVNPVGIGIGKQRISPCSRLSGIEQGIAIVIGIGVVALPVAIGVQRLSCIVGEGI